MQPGKHRVAIVVDEHFGGSLDLLMQRMHVWLIESTENNAAAKRVWAADGNSNSLLCGVTTFRASSTETHEEALIRLLETVDEHHDYYGCECPWDSIEVYGVGLTDPIACELAQYGVVRFDVSADGFVGYRGGEER